MAIKVSGTEVIDSSRQLTNITGLDATTQSTIESVINLNNRSVGTVTSTGTLDLSTGTVFQYTPTDDTTFVFNNPPASGTGYSFDLQVTGVDVGTPYNLTEAAPAFDFPGRLDLRDQTGSPTDLFFKPDGTKLYVIAGAGEDAVFQYDLSTAWELSTATYVQSFSVSSQEVNPEAVFFKSDGTKMYVTGTSSDSIHEYNLSTAWDISTASYNSNSFNASSQEPTITGLFFKSDGTKMYVTGTSSDSIHEYNLSTAWNVSTASFFQTLSIASDETQPRGLFFSDDGLKMYFTGTAGDDVPQYNLSTAWDISTASRVTSRSVRNQAPSPQGVFFKPDGTRMYVVCNSEDGVFSYTLSTAWSIATFAWDQPTVGYFNFTSQDSNTNAAFFKPDGTKMYILGATFDRIYMYNLSTPWALSSATYSNVSFTVGGQDSSPEGLFFKADGTKMYMLGQTTDTVYQYDLSVAWDLSTAGYSSLKSFSVAAQESGPGGLTFKSDGTKFYIIGVNSDSVHEYSTPVPWDISVASHTQSFSLSSAISTAKGVQFSSDGTKMFTSDDSGSVVTVYNLSTAWNISTASYDTEYITYLSGYSPEDVFFKADGTSMFIVDSINNSIWEFSTGKLPEPATFTYPSSVTWKNNTDPGTINDGDTIIASFITSDGGTNYYGDVVYDSRNYDAAPTGTVTSQTLDLSTGNTFEYTPSAHTTFVFDNAPASGKAYDFSLKITGAEVGNPYDLENAEVVGNPGSIGVYDQDRTPTGVFLNDDSTLLYLTGRQNDRIYLYYLTTPGDLRTAVYSNASFSVSSQASAVQDIFFKPDGTKMYITGSVSDSVHEYDLSTAWDISTATFLQSFSVATQNGYPTGLFFKPDGTKMYISGITPDAIDEYNLSTAWDISSASHLQSFSSGAFTAYIGSAQSVFFKPDGTKMYVSDQSGDDINEFNLSTAWDISTASHSQALNIDQQAYATGVFFTSDGTKMYTVSEATDTAYSYTLSTAWDISSAVWDAPTAGYANINDQNTAPRGLAFKPDGTKMYVVEGLNTVQEYDLSTAWDLTTVSFLQEFSVAAQDTSVYDVAFKLDGTKMYIVGDNGNDVNEYDLSTAWDVSTASYVTNFSISDEESLVRSLEFKPDGTKMYIIGQGLDTVFEYALVAPWSISTAYYSGNFFNVNSQETTPLTLAFNGDGTKMYIAGTAGDDVNEYSLTTAWDVSTASYTGVSFKIQSQGINPSGLFFKPDGSSLFVTDASSRAVWEYYTGEALTDATFTYPSSVTWKNSTPPLAPKAGDTIVANFLTVDGGTTYYGELDYDSRNYVDATPVGTTTNQTLDLSTSNVFDYTPTADTSFVFVNPPASGTAYKFFLKLNGAEVGSPYDLANAEPVFDFPGRLSLIDLAAGIHGIFFKPDGTRLYVLDSDNEALYEYFLTIPWDVSTAVLGRTGDIPRYSYDLFFKTDGTKLYLANPISNAVTEYDLSIAWDTTTASFVQDFDVNTQATNVSGLFFKPDGTKMYITGSGADDVYEYDLSTAWDLSTASYVQNFVTSGISSSETIFFKPDGTKMYITDSGGDDVNEFNLSTAWDVSTASFVQVFSVQSQESSPRAFFFKSDGTQMYVAGFNTDSVYQYSLSTAWDTSTASYSNPTTGFLDVSAQAPSPQAVSFKPDGTKMYVLDISGDEVNEYTLSTAWDITTASFVQLLNVAPQDNSPTGLFFKPDGTKMYIAGYSGDEVNEYDLSTAWDISTASYLQTFSVAGQDSVPYGLFFKPDGSKMYVVGSNDKDINEYTLSTAWDITTATFAQSFSVIDQMTSPRNVFFKPDGTGYFIAGRLGDDVNEYSLSTAWDISTSVFVQSLSILSAMNNVTGIFIDTTGTRMYLCETDNGGVYQYTIGTPLSTSTFSYPSSVKWPGGTAPTDPAIGETDLLQFLTTDGGTTYLGRVVGDNFS